MDMLKTCLAAPLIIPVFLPEKGCPHKCIYCCQTTITGEFKARADGAYVKKTVRQFISGVKKDRLPGEVAFYGGNFLGLSKDEIINVVKTARSLYDDNVITGIRFSTRPDTIIKDRLDLLKGIPVKAVELGVQSMDDTVLAASLRGHTAADTVKAALLLRKLGYVTGLQVMIGLPEDTPEKCLMTARSVAELAPAFTRIYPTLVIKGSPLAVLYQKGKYRPLSLDDAVEQTAAVFQVFRKSNIPVVRMGLQAEDGLVPGKTVFAGPYHPAFGQLVYSRIYFEKVKRLLDDYGELPEILTVYVNPREISKFRGDKNLNIKRLTNTYGFNRVLVSGDDRVAAGKVRLSL